MTPPKILVFQHHPAEHLGRFTPLFGARGIVPVAVQLDQGEPIPELSGFDGLWVLGGPQQVWQEEEHPWLAAEKAAIRKAVTDLNMPYLGLCLGHQLLADALGGEVATCAAPEVGILPVMLTDTGRAHGLFRGLGPQMTCVQGHGAEVSRLPDGATVLARSDACDVQAMQVGQRAFSLQFHMELTPAMISDCLELPEYKADFEAMLGVEGVAAFQAENRERAGQFQTDAETLLSNWMRLAFEAA